MRTASRKPTSRPGSAMTRDRQAALARVVAVPLVKVVPSAKVLGLSVLLAGGITLAVSCVESHSTTHGPAASSAGPASGAGPSSGAGSTGAGAGFDKHALLQNLGEHVVLATYQAFATEAKALASACDAWQSADTSEARAAARADAQAAWRDAMKVWQSAELMQIGPAAPMSTPGGQDQRDEIYSWPSVNACVVDQEIVKGEYATPSAFANKLVNARGLAALEHLLFDSDTKNACAPQNTINAAGTWSAILGQLDSRRAAYAATLAILIEAKAVGLRDAWEPAGGNYADELATPGAIYQASAQQALNAVTNAMFYLDTELKDMKLAIPAGLSLDCATVTCPEALELREAGFSKAAVRANISGFQRLFHGGAPFETEALGFDDWLVAAGASELAAQMAADISAAIAAVDAIQDDDLKTTLANEPERVVAVYDAIKRVTDNLKTQFVTVLDLGLPDAAATDND
ncbi:MAG: hypothetical protein EXR75_12255 [Myxococcales bacterium]|nr:hypothetical protein [Myxococcales bacterium]